jgi:AcrR family transcriptional regulator
MRSRSPRQFSPRQEEVLDSVEGAFLRDGLAGVRIGALAAEAHCSRSTLYEMARTKEELFLLVLGRMLRRISQRGAAEIAGHDDPVERLRAMLVSGSLDFAPFSATFTEAVQDYAPARTILDRHLAAARDVLAELIDDAVRAGRFRPVNSLIVADGLFGVVRRFTEPGSVQATGVSSGAAMLEFTDALIDGLRSAATG